jgi:hypothetical protein
MTQILKSGPPGQKKNIAVLGDGFASADQTKYNDKVKELLIDGVFGNDYFYEDKSAFNIYRVNLISKESGVSQRVYDEKGTPDDYRDDTIVSTTMKDTALKYIYSGSWAHCWLEGSTETGTLANNALDKWVPDYDLVVILLNENGDGGCGGGGWQVVTSGVGWSVLAHEFGHGTGNLADEYCTTQVYTKSEPSRVNITTNTNRSTLKWKKFVNSTTSIPTGVGNCADYNQGSKPAGWHDSHDAGLFEGGGTYNSGMYRPAIDCRMRGNSPPYCPVCYTTLKTIMDSNTQRSFLKCYPGDFNGDGKDDLLVHNGNSIQIYRSNGSQLDIVFSAVERVQGSWQFQPNDKFYIGDFNGDGKDEVVIYNGIDWVMEYLGLLADDGNNGLKLIARYNDSMPAWQFQKADRFYVADFNGDGKKDLFVFNGSNWSIPYLGMLRSNGTSLSMTKRYDANMPGWEMRPGDKHYVADFNGDGKKDLFVFNGSNWSMAYLGMLKSNTSSLSMTRRYDGNAPGWQMRKNDRHYVGNINGDRKEDLFVCNYLDWSKEYLGTMVSSGGSLSCNWKEDWVGEWNLGGVDQFEPCNYEGVSGKRNLFVHNVNWFGMVRGKPTLSLQKIYYRWIHNYRYGRNW